MNPPAAARTTFREIVYRGLFFLGLGAFIVLVVVGAARATVVHKRPSLYDAADVYSRATEMEDAGDVAGAIRELRAAVHVQPQELTGYQRLGYLQGTAGDPEGELATYERAFSFNPLAPRANMILGLAYLRRERLAEAEARLRLAVSLDERDAMLRAALGDLLVAEKKYEEAAVVLESALALEPGETALHNKAAIAYAYAGQLEAARGHFERAVQLNPGNEEAAANLRQLLALMAGDPPSASGPGGGKP